MTSDDRTHESQPPAEQARGEQEWEAPALTELGDARALTQAQSLAVNDGTGGSS